jgi:hypothetical protein
MAAPPPPLPAAPALVPAQTHDPVSLITVDDMAMAGAPPWGLAIYNAVTALQVQVTALQVQGMTLQAWTFNVQADRADDAIQWPQIGAAVPLPAVPNTVEELRSLGPGPCAALLAYYGLPVGGTVAVRRLALARHIGLPRGSL